MKKRGLAAVLVALTSCGVTPIPRTVPLNVVSVDIPATLPVGADLTVNVKYAVDCNVTDEKTLLVDRRSWALKLEAVGLNNGTNTACPAVYTEKTLTYADSGTVTRTSPFEVIVNGKSWGKIEIK